MRIDSNGGLQGTGVTPDPKSDGAGRANQTAQSNPAGRPEDAEESKRADAEPSPDSLEISPKAQELLAKTQQKNNAAEPDLVRQEKVERAKQVIQDGSYNNRGALEKTADKLAKLFSVDA